MISRWCASLKHKIMASVKAELIDHGGIRILYINLIAFEDPMYQAHHQHFAGKVLKDYRRESVVVAMKWGPWIEPGKGFPPMDFSPAECRCLFCQIFLTGIFCITPFRCALLLHASVNDIAMDDHHVKMLTSALQLQWRR